MKKDNTRQIYLITFLFSICLFFISFNYYDVVYSHAFVFESDIIINTQNIGTKFLRSIVFATILSITPVVSVFISKRYSELRFNKIIKFFFILLFAEASGFFVRLLYLQRKASSGVVTQSSLSFKDIRIEESMLLSGTLAAIIAVTLVKLSKK